MNITLYRPMRNISHLAVMLLFILPAVTSAQYTLNFGLREKQATGELPHSLAPLVPPVPKARVLPQTVLETVHRGEWILKDGWELCESNKVMSSSRSLFSPDYESKYWYNATVPGTVLTTLVDQGVYANPYYGLNNMAIPDTLCRTDWWYRISFRLPEEKKGNKIWLLFNGINYKADVWLNGKMVGKIAGCFQRGEFEITAYLNAAGDNILAVHIFPPNNPGIPHEESALSGPGPNGGQLCLDGPTFISSEGWDWVPGIRDRNIGIWQDVRLRITGDLKITDPQIITDLPLPDTSSAAVVVRVQLQNTSDLQKKAVVSGKIEDHSFSKNIALEPGEVRTVIFDPKEFPTLRFDNPRLWWPNGYGRPDLYKLQLSVSDEDASVSDQLLLQFGIRELTYELTVDVPGHQGSRVEYNPTKSMEYGKPLFDNLHRRDVGDGVVVPRLREEVDTGWLTPLADTATAPYLVIKVNGLRIFCKGGNWGMDDAMKRVSRERLEPYFRLHRDANFNMIRNWTGESTEEIFYELCDEYGMLVWNDFWLSTEGYNLDVNDNHLFLNNALDVVRRFRNHPSIAIWCPRNEGYAPSAFEERLEQLIAREDGTRHYQPNSRYMNLRPSGPWHYFKDPADYFRFNAHGFNTEQGTPSVPTAASMRRMMAPEDVWPIGDVWFYHDLHNGQQEYLAAIETLYGPAASLEDFCKKAQMINYDSHRAMFESWNSRLWNNTTGLLLWMTHPAWPSTVWQVYSWDYETSGSYFGSKKACEPLHVQMNLHDNRVIVVNTTPDEIGDAKVSLHYYDMAGKLIYEKVGHVTVAANATTFCFMPEARAGLPVIYLARLLLTDRRGKVISLNDYWKSTSDQHDFKEMNHTEDPVLIAESFGEIKHDSAHLFELVLRNTSNVPAIGIKLNLRYLNTGEVALPAYFTDGYFNLLPGESRTIYVETSAEPAGKAEVVAKGYNIRETVIGLIGSNNR